MDNITSASGGQAVKAGGEFAFQYRCAGVRNRLFIAFIMQQTFLEELSAWCYYQNGRRFASFRC